MGYNLKKMIYEVGAGIPNGRQLKTGGTRAALLAPASPRMRSMSRWISIPCQKVGSMLVRGVSVVVDDIQCTVKFCAAHHEVTHEVADGAFPVAVMVRIG